jgi:hypothetical protein
MDDGAYPESQRSEDRGTMVADILYYIMLVRFAITRSSRDPNMSQCGQYDSVAVNGAELDPDRCASV